MFRLSQKKLDQSNGEKAAAPNAFVGLRSQLLPKEFQEAVEKCPDGCEIVVSNPDCLHKFQMIIKPEEGYWKGGRFVFDVEVPEEYNFVPPKCVCRTKIWHPNIAESGEICLSILRENHLNTGLGWLPTRSLKEVVWGVNSLFSDLLDFDDPLNLQAAEMHQRSSSEFVKRVSVYVEKYATPRPPVEPSPDEVEEERQRYRRGYGRPWDGFF